LIDTITADVLPPSLGIRAKSIDNLSEIIGQINQEKEKNPFIDEIWYFEDVLETIRAISKTIDSAVLIMVPALSIIAFTLIVITIGFNVALHKEEIEIMHLVGSDDSYIKWPFKFEGMFYGILGGIISSALILIPWFVLLNSSQNTELHVLIQQTLRDFNLEIITSPSILFVGGFLGIQILTGLIIGYIGSAVALIRHLNLKKA
jgi:cell division transport system permease protein